MVSKPLLVMSGLNEFINQTFMRPIAADKKNVKAYIKAFIQSSKNSNLYDVTVSSDYCYL